MAYWLERSKSIRLWGKRSAVYRLFQFRCNGHHLKSETSKHKVKDSGGDWRTKRGNNLCVLCKQHKECPARLLFECSSSEGARNKFLRAVRIDGGDEVAKGLEDGRATERWDRVKGWLDGKGWEGSEDAFDLVLQHLVTFVHDTLELRLSALR